MLAEDGDDLQHLGRAHAQADAQDPADQAEDDRLEQELEENVGLLGPDRHPDADLADALGHRDEHDVHDPDPPDEERDRGDAAQQELEDAHRALQALGDVGHVPDVEVVVLEIQDMVAVAEQAPCTRSACLV